MKQLSLAVAAAVALMSLGTTTAPAGETCRIVKSWCPPDALGSKDSPSRTSVPEPASLLLLGAGVSAVSAAIARRRKNNKDR
jgi:hypothetical protein